jgi:protein-tyrosine phosphatase
MTRHQRRLVLAQAPLALRRTFTLPEAADLLTGTDLRGLQELPMRRRAGELALRLNDGRARRRGVEADDVYDPIGQSASVHGQVAARIGRKIRPLADVLFVDAPEGPRLPSPDPARRAAMLPPLVPTRTR